MSDECRVERDGPILTVTLARPDKLNALNAGMHRRLEATWDAFFADPDLRVAILTGAGSKAFCVGSDLSSWDDNEPSYSVAAGYAGLTHRVHWPKPIIAAVNGVAFGGGFELMLCCDLAVASENALFALPEPLVGAAALAGGIPRLCRKLPHNRAMTLLMTGERMSAAEALQWGLVGEVVPPGEVLAAAKALAQRVLRCAPLAVQATKAIADAVLRGDALADVLAFEQGSPTRLVRESDDVREGISASFDKREPMWKGR
jgi:enoyl-CoA hydratase/carnithine racemase